MSFNFPFFGNKVAITGQKAPNCRSISLTSEGPPNDKMMGNSGQKNENCSWT